MWPHDPRTPPDALVFSHAHPDHYGLQHLAKPEIPRYTTATTRRIIEYLQFNARDVPADAWQLPTWRPLVPHRPTTIGPFRITPLPSDHSTVGTCALLVEVAGRRLLYTGDFRRHGAPELWHRMLAAVPRPLDLLLIEGTTILRPREPDLPSTEADLEAELVALMRRPGPILYVASSINVPRLERFRAAAAATDRLLVLPPTVVFLLVALRAAGVATLDPLTDPVLRPHFDRNLAARARAFAEGLLGAEPVGAYVWRLARRKVSTTAKNGAPGLPDLADRLVMHVSGSSVVALRKAFRNGLGPGTFVYSLWSGYRDSRSMQTLTELLREQGYREQTLHVSGHADLATLRETIAHLAPRRVLPVHTPDPAHFRELIPGPTYVEAQDGEPIAV